MNEQINFHKTEDTPKNSLATLLGFFLLLTGTASGLWIIITVYRIFTDPSELARFYQSVPSITINLPESIADNQKADLVKMVQEALKYILMIATGISSAFIAAGAHLVYSNYQKIMTKLSGLETRINARLNKFENRQQGT